VHTLGESIVGLFERWHEWGFVDPCFVDEGRPLQGEDLTEITWLGQPDSSAHRLVGDGSKRPHCSRTLTRGHDGLAYQYGVEAGSVQHGGVIWSSDAGLGHSNELFGDLWCHAHGAFLVDLKRHQISLIHTDDLGVDGQGSFEFGFVVDLEQGGQANCARSACELGQLVVVQSGGDEQHGIGAHQASVVHVVDSDREVLADDRQVHCRTSSLKVSRRTAEVIGIGQHRQTGGTSGSVGSGDFGRVQICGQFTLGRGPALHLGDHAQSRRT